MALETWQLKRGAEILAELLLTEVDQPWLFCSFHPAAAYSSVAAFFANDAALLESRDHDAQEAAMEAIDNLGLTLINTSSGESFSEFWLHIQEGKAWFRC